jgi:hypothetical protein
MKQASTNLCDKGKASIRGGRNKGDQGSRGVAYFYVQRWARIGHLMIPWTLGANTSSFSIGITSGIKHEELP